MKPIVFVVLFFAPYASSFIIPQEIPSLLSLVYSNIPPVKKGTDSRIGFGYRFGDHADFQVQFEIGPQKETQKIGSINANKRSVKATDAAQQLRKTERLNLQKELQQEQKESGWLRNWSNRQKQPQQPEESILEPQPSISQADFLQLQQLYSSSSQTTPETEKSEKEN